MKSNDNLKIKAKKKNKVIVILRLIMIIITIYSILRVSYALNYDNLNYHNFFDVLYKRLLNPFPFVITYNHYSLSVLLIWIIAWIFKLKEKAIPKVDYEWQGIEQGSNRFYTKSEVDDFIEKKTDPIVPLFDYKV